MKVVTKELIRNNHPKLPGYEAIGICGHDYWVKYIVMRKATRKFIYIYIYIIDIIYNIQYGHFRTIIEYLILHGKERRDWKQLYLLKNLVGNTCYALIKVKEK